MAPNHMTGKQARIVHVEARRTPLEVDSATACSSSICRMTLAARAVCSTVGQRYSGIQKVVGPTVNVLAAARQAGIKVIYLKMGYRSRSLRYGGARLYQSGASSTRGRWPNVRRADGSEGRILIRDTWNTDILPALEPHADDLIVYKTGFSGFYATELDDRLQEMGIRHLIVTGCTTSICVESTVRDAMFRDYLCVLLADCMAEPGNDIARSNHEATLFAAEASFGWVSSSDQFVEALERPMVAAATPERPSGS